jgi:uncharacterized protein YutE (UPF0331/DUF86 family)
VSLNPDVVRARCSDIEEAVAALERFRVLPREDFVGNRDFVDAACYRLLVAIEAAVALCYHVSAKHLRKVPDEYAACFGVLREAGVIASDLASRLQTMARFRNLLVHMYARVDAGRVHQAICDDLGDLRQLAAAAAGLLDPGPPAAKALPE